MTDEFPQLPPDAIARARAMYDDAATNAEIREYLGLTEKQFLAFRRAQGWPLRTRFAVPPRRAPAWAEDDFAPALESLTPDELIARMETAAAREFVRAERAMADKRPRSAEARLRVMAHLVKMLGDLRRMRGVGMREDETMAPEEAPPDMDALRAELMRRLDRIRQERRETRTETSAHATPAGTDGS